MSKFFGVILLLCGICFGCSPKIKPFLWLTGTWEMRRSAGGNRLEIWTQKNDESLTGKGLRIEEKDSFLLEKIELVYRDDQFWYIPTVSDQNNGEPIEFKLSKTEGSIYTFENPNHDFPQRIIYQFKPSGGTAQDATSHGDSLLVRVESLDGNGIDYGFERRK